ncbi:MAG TPA: hypothetical protein VGL55_03750 [Steroidobacteraceae bacterium]
MNIFNRIVLLATFGAVLGVSGCIVERDHGPYRYDHGDRIDRYGHHEAHWCDNHRDDEHCRY